MNANIEVLILPVADVDRALAFYTEKAGFTLDVDYAPTDEAMRGYAPRQSRRHHLTRSRRRRCPISTSPGEPGEPELAGRESQAG